MAEREQSYKSHTRWLPGYHFFVMPVLLINLINALRHVVLSPTRHTAWEVVLGAALLLLGLLSRVMTLTVQDRVIRLEERLRYERVLPAELQVRTAELTIGQIVSLRFASDAELPALARRVLDDKVTARRAIKELIKQWRPDYLRA